MHRQDLDDVWAAAIDDPVWPANQLTKIRVGPLRDDSPRIRKLPKLARRCKQSLHHQLGVRWRVPFNELADPREVVSGRGAA